MGPPMVSLEADFQRASGDATFGCVSRAVFSMYEQNYRTRISPLPPPSSRSIWRNDLSIDQINDVVDNIHQEDD